VCDSSIDALPATRGKPDGVGADFTVLMLVARVPWAVAVFLSENTSCDDDLASE